MAQAKHEDFRGGKFISLWLGNLNSEDELDDYLSEQFEQDFGFEIYSPAGPEADVSEDGPKPIRELLEGFSKWETFIDLAVAEAHSQGWEEATTALVFHNLQFRPEFIHPEASGDLQFIGVIPFGEW